MASSDSDDSPSSANDSRGRDDLIAAASQIFADRGYTGATTTEIARRAGVSQPLLYHHFDSKKGLWRAVIDTLFGEMRQELAGVVEQLTDASRKERLSELMTTFVRFTGHNPELGRLIRVESRAGGEAFDELYEHWVDDLVDFFNRELSAGQEDGTLRRMEPADLYFIVAGASTEPFIQPEIARRTFGVDTTDEAFIERYAETVVDALLEGVTAKD